MPVLSKFCGVVIRMLVIRFFPAHFYAFYGDSELVVGIVPVCVLQGQAPEQVRSMVLEWATKHQGELMEAWNRLSAHERPHPIAA